MTQAKLAITRSDQDLLRVIPWKITGALGPAVEFKVATLGNSYSLEYWSVQQHPPETHVVSSEITYHCSKLEDDHIMEGTIHVKDKDQLGTNRYRFRFPSVTDVSIYAEFPIPVLRFVAPAEAARTYTCRDYHFTLDLDDPDVRPSNVLELYAVSPAFHPETFMRKWPNISELWNCTNIDYVTRGVYLSRVFLDRLREGPFLAGIGYDFGDFHLLARPSPQDAQGGCISFYDNYYYLTALATAPVQLVDDTSGKPLSAIRYAFEFDLDYQRRTGAPEDQIAFWRYFFTELLSHFEDPWNASTNKCFQIPQISQA